MLRTKPKRTSTLPTEHRITIGELGHLLEIYSYPLALEDEDVVIVAHWYSETANETDSVPVIDWLEIDYIPALSLPPMLDYDDSDAWLAALTIRHGRDNAGRLWNELTEWVEEDAIEQGKVY